MALHTSLARSRRHGNKRGLQARRALSFEALETRWLMTVPALQTAAAGDLTAPVVATHAGDGSGRIFVAELFGQVRVVENGSAAATPFLDLSSRMVADPDRGLLGLAFHPDYAVEDAVGEGRFYVYYTAPATMGGSHDSVVSEFSVSADDPNQADEASERVLLRFDHPHCTSHNGGDLKFGPDDGLLYISTGDGACSGDPQGNSQNLGTVLGKILRIDVAGGDDFPDDPNRDFAVPASNPFVNDPQAQGEIFAYGFRNPFRMSFDDGPDGAASPDRLFVGDVGQNLFEEVDLVTSGGNYGWNVCEATHAFPIASQPCPAGYINPIAEYGRSVGVSVIGGFVYRGSRLPELDGVYLFGDLTGTVLALEEQGGTFVRSRVVVTGETPGNIIGFGEDEAGELYLLTFSQMLSLHSTTVDFGDAPASYSTSKEDRGAVHDATGPTLGSQRDVELDGRPSVGADGDNLSDTDDEDGVAFNAPLFIGQAATVDVVASADGNLNAWIDFNHDGNFDDAGEQILTDRAVVAGANNLPFTNSPAGIVGVTTYARFRLTSSTSVSYKGVAVDGEVEDYQVSLVTESDKIGIQRGNQFYLDANASGRWDTGDRANTFGNTTDVALTGDWNGDGRDEIGLRRGGIYYLDRNGNGVWNGIAGGDVAFTFRSASGIAFHGDWNGNGFDDLGVQEGNKFYLDFNGNGTWDEVAGGDRLIAFGNPGDTPIAGDWNGDGREDIGVRRGSTFYLDVNSNGIWNGVAGGDAFYVLGAAGDRPLVGDWNADGRDNIGYQRGNIFFLDANGNGQEDSVASGDQRYTFGNTTDLPLIGKWRPNGALLAAGGMATVAIATEELTSAALAPILQQAIILWADTGLTSSQLQALRSVQVGIADLPGAQLGLSLGGTILIDRDAAGYGWFVDPTPADDAEFSNFLLSKPQSLDLLSAVLHELGHELGFDHDDDFAAMCETLAAGTRRLP